MGAKKFPGPPFYPIALNGPTDLSTDCQPEPDGTARFIQYDDYEIGGMYFSPPLPDAIEITVPVKPTGGRKIVSLFHLLDRQQMSLRRNRCRQIFAPAGTAALDDGLTVFGLHPLAKTMSSFTADFTGLISAFHFAATPCLLFRYAYFFDKQQRILLSIFSKSCQEGNDFRARPSATKRDG